MPHSEPFRIEDESPHETRTKIIIRGQNANITFSAGGHVVGDSDLDGKLVFLLPEGVHDVDHFNASGDMASMEFVDPSGEPSTPDDTTTDEPTTDEPTTHTIQFEGTGTPCNYTFTVSGSVAPAGDFPDGSYESAGDTSATGWVTSEGSTDTFEFTGDLTDEWFIEGSCAVELDGTPYEFGN